MNQDASNKLMASSSIVTIKSKAALLFKIVRKEPVETKAVLNASRGTTLRIISATGATYRAVPSVQVDTSVPNARVISCRSCKRQCVDLSKVTASAISETILSLICNRTDLVPALVKRVIG